MDERRTPLAELAVEAEQTAQRMIDTLFDQAEAAAYRWEPPSQDGGHIRTAGAKRLVIAYVLRKLDEAVRNEPGMFG